MFRFCFLHFPSQKNSDERLWRIAELLMGIKIIKLNAWEKVFTEKIQRSREKELQCLDKDSIYWTLMSEYCRDTRNLSINTSLANKSPLHSSRPAFHVAFLTHLSSVIITVVTIAVFLSIETTDVTDKFTTARVFAALALFNQLTVPLFIFPITIPMIISAIVSTRRLETFLQQCEVQKEFEGIRNMARVMSRSDASLDVFEIDETFDGQQQQQQQHSQMTPTVDDDDDGRQQQMESQAATSMQPNEALLLSKNQPHLNKGHFSRSDSIDGGGSGSGGNNECPMFSNDFYLQEIYENQQDDLSTPFNKTQCSFVPAQRRPFNASIKLKKKNQISDIVKIDRNRTRQKSLTTTEIQMEIPNELVLSIRNAAFSWQPSSSSSSSAAVDSMSVEHEPLLCIDRLDIPRG